jgi:mannose/fructose-specific phosphotransferase system component IIA
MSEVRGAVVAHGNLARCLVETVESISGAEGALRPISNEGCSPELLMVRIRNAIGAEPALVFVDLASGSCSHAARLVAREGSGIPVVSGVNLPMLLDFVFHRDMELSELSRRAVEKGHAGTIAHLPDLSP